eukprot:TRINITY_DN1410_c0_g1_i3.p1 TRINITY_DN1410_c0_g1~~TRINITY_DN1410_c0_g1_i3.p1  ORF type:complete len:532 (-),score=137.41 TRINITY_DN1410_c0_g1_i3:69-1664(-)
MRFLRLVLSCLAASVVLASDDQLLKPISSDGPQLAMLIFQGAQIGADQYVSLATAIQQATTGVQLWVSIPAALLDVQNPFTIGSAVTRAKQSLADAGYNSTDYIVAGHSLGGVAIQGYSESNPDGIVAQVLMGSALQRKYRGTSYAIPTLTVGGELDGLFRVTRVAEEYYNAIHLAADYQTAATNFPVVVIEGMNHFQWATGSMPLLVTERDLKPEITTEDAQAKGASVIASYIKSIAYGDAASQTSLVSAVKTTGNWAAPIVAAYELEGSREFNAPAQKGGPSENCPKGGCVGTGSDWAKQAQEYVANLPIYAQHGMTLDVTNQFVQLSSLPPFGEFHLPVMSNDSSDPTLRHLTTYSQCSWETLDGLDTGFISTSATEIGTKMMSRQCNYIRGVGLSENPDAPFSLDDPNFCAEINNAAYQWAIDNAGATTRSRFQSVGQKYVFGDDVAEFAGPLWLNAALQYNTQTGSDGVQVTQIVAPMIKTSADFIQIPLLPDPSCYHYCKLLSPARATEWIYVDSLRLNYGVTSS